MGGTALTDIVDLAITIEAARVTQLGFGTPLILGETSRVYDRVLTYTDPASMLTDGFETTDNLYIAALKLMSQELSPAQFKIGRKLANVNSKCTVSFTGTPSAGTWTLDVSIGGATAVTSGAITYAADNDCAVIKAALEAMAGITEVTVTGLYSTGYVIEFTGADASADFRVSDPDVSSLTGVTAAVVTMTQHGSAIETWVEADAAIRVIDSDFYALIADTKTKADIEALAAVYETLTKIFFARSEDADIVTSATDDVGSDLQDGSYDRTALMYHGVDCDNYPEAAWVGGQLPEDPGSTTWKFKTLAGITVDDLAATKVAYLRAKNVNYHDTVAGINAVFGEGVVASGEYVDIIRGCDCLKARISEGIFTVLTTNKKIPFTIPGLAVFETVIRYWLGKGVDAGLLVEGSQIVNVPNLDDISSADKLIRYLNGITFSADLAGAIHKVGIAGRLAI